MAHASPRKEPHSRPSLEEPASRNLVIDQGGLAPSDGVLDEEDGNSLPLLPSKPEAEGRGHSGDREIRTREDDKTAQPESERSLSRLQSTNLL